MVVKKKIQKMVISTENEAYRDFDLDSAEMTEKFIGAHLYEFIRESDDAIPEVFTHLFQYFRTNDRMHPEGIFRKQGDESNLKEIRTETQKRNFAILDNHRPEDVAVFMKRVL